MKVINKFKCFFEYKDRLDLALLFLRVSVSVQLMIVHGFKKVGLSVDKIENIPNPFNLPEVFNDLFAITSNLIFPVFVIVGYYTRLACIPILIVTLSGYFIVHWNDSLIAKDIPFMYSLVYLFIAFTGGGKYSMYSKF